MTRRFGLPLAASIAGHGCLVALLILLVGQLPPMPLPIATRGIQIMLARPVADTPPPPPEPAPEAQPPPIEPPPAVVEATPPPPPPPPKPTVKAAPRRPPPPAPTQAPLQTAMVPRPVPVEPSLPAPTPAPIGPIVSAGYRAALSSWLESHKRYPEGARERGEEGRAVLRFRVDRSGRVLSYAVAQSTGHPDLDAALDQMMRGASLPPFPADMTAPEVEVSVAIRFALAH